MNNGQKIDITITPKTDGILRIITANYFYEININTSHYTFKIEDDSKIPSAGFKAKQSLLFFQNQF